MRARNWILLGALGLISSCASMYDSMGLVTKDALVARDQRLQALETQGQNVSAQIQDLSAQVAETKDAAKKVAEVESLMKALQGRIDLLPQQTLKSLAEILQKAADEAAKP